MSHVWGGRRAPPGAYSRGSTIFGSYPALLRVRTARSWVWRAGIVLHSEDAPTQEPTAAPPPNSPSDPRRCAPPLTGSSLPLCLAWLLDNSECLAPSGAAGTSPRIHRPQPPSSLLMLDPCGTARKKSKTAPPTAVVLAVHAWLLCIQGARWIPWGAAPLFPMSDSCGTTRKNLGAAPPTAVVLIVHA